MSMGRPYRRLRLLRVFVLGLFAFALVLQPVLATAGELHELTHDASTRHTHALHAGEVAKASSAPDAPGDGAATLHTLSHFCHCCGSCAAAMAVLRPIVFKPMRDHVAVPQARMPVKTRLPAPFKPPIFA